MTTKNPGPLWPAIRSSYARAILIAREKLEHASGWGKLAARAAAEAAGRRLSELVGLEGEP